MTARAQIRLALLGALAGASLFVAANVHLIVRAVQSQPACTATEAGPMPAQRAC
ncbi:hypothetical protein [Acidimangrovimonas pyrenivorans]|uniref:Uncharacterized protein n=1 Tax=Acidimangrovimonas pyrenivorans TaxID=2030798 RepID=A0ABV7AF14_9RHOB